MNNNDKLLIRGLIEENKSSEEKFYIFFRPILHQIAMKYMKNQSTAEDLTHDLFIKLFSEIKKGRNINNLLGWVSKTSNHFCLDQVRKQKPEKKIFPHQFSLDSQDLIENAMDENAIIPGTRRYYNETDYLIYLNSAFKKEYFNISS